MPGASGIWPFVRSGLALDVGIEGGSSPFNDGLAQSWTLDGTNPPTWSSAAPYAGVFATPSHINAPGTTAIPAGDVFSFLAAFYANPTQPGGGGTIISGSAIATFQWRVRGDAPTGGLQLLKSDTVDMGSTSRSNYVGRWIIAAVTYDGASLKFYDNGVLDNSVAIVTTGFQQTSTTWIGARQNLIEGLSGQIKYVGGWNRALSQYEILQSSKAVAQYMAMRGIRIEPLLPDDFSYFALPPQSAPNIGFARYTAPNVVGGQPDPTNQFRSTRAYPVPDPPAPPGSASFWRLPGPQVGFGRKGGPFTGIVPPRAYLAPTSVGADLAGSIGGSAALRGDIAIAEALAGAIAGATTLKADVALAEALAGAIAGPTALAGAASLAEALAGTIAGTTALSGPLSLAEALQGSLAGGSALSGALTLIESLQGSIAGSAALSGTLSEAVALQGAIAGATALPGSLSLAIALAGSIGGAAALKGDLQTQSGAALAGSIGGASAALGRLSEALALAGAIAGSSAFTSEVPAPPPAQSSGQRKSGGRPVIRIEERTERVQVLALQVFQKAARERPTPSSATAGSMAPAKPAIATLRTATGSASGAGIARAQASVMVLTGHRSSGRGVHNPPDEAPLILACFYPDLLKARRRALPEIDRQRHAVLHAEAAIKAHVRSFLHMMAVRLAMLARGRHVHKAAGADDEVKAAAEATDFDQLEQEIAPYLRAVAKDGAREGLRQVDADIEAMLSQANERAVTWANDHAGVLIKGIATTTRERIAELVARSARDGWAHDKLADEIQDAGVFGDARAEMIARTEAAYADMSGNLIGWKESGVVTAKMWRTGGGACDECEPLDGETVPIDEEFEDGGPPLHPNCRCDLIPVLADE